jgi:hypothetical protein
LKEKIHSFTTNKTILKQAGRQQQNLHERKRKSSKAKQSNNIPVSKLRHYLFILI